MLKKCVLFFTVLFMFFSCKDHNEVDMGKVTFLNTSSYKIAVYKNINPATSDNDTTPLVSLKAGKQETVDLFPSRDQNVADVFYVHYYVQLADALQSGVGEAIFAKAERDTTNVQFVVSKNKHHTETIGNPTTDSPLKFVYGYIKVENKSGKDIQVWQDTIGLDAIGSDDLNLDGGKTAFYEIKLSDLTKDGKFKDLLIRDVNDDKKYKIDPFVLERGKLYTFTYDGTSVNKKDASNITY